MADITFFQDDEGNILSRPQTTSLTELKQMIKEGRPSRAISLHKQFVINGIHWNLYDKHMEEVAKVEAENQEITEWNDTLEQWNLENPEDLREPKELKELPILSFTETTSVDGMISDVLKSQSKLSAFEFKGISCSATEADQNGWGSIAMLIDIAEGQGIPFEPVNFKNENGNMVTLETKAEWLDFVLTGANARKEYFK